MAGSLILKFIDSSRQKLLYKILYWIARYGLGLTFIISGIRKLPGVLFTILPVDNPVGAYFHAMHETGFYWNFIGYFQIVVGVVVFVNRFSALASLLMMPVTVNIFLISIALHMTGTPVITSLMLLGNIYLLLWKYQKFLPLVRA